MLSGILLGSFTQPSSMYNVGDIVTIKTVKELKKIGSKFSHGDRGFYIKRGLFINNEMLCFCGNKYKIAEINKGLDFCNDKTGYCLTLGNTIRYWVWDDTCFQTLPEQFELEF